MRKEEKNNDIAVWCDFLFVHNFYWCIEPERKSDIDLIGGRCRYIWSPAVQLLDCWLSPVNARDCCLMRFSFHLVQYCRRRPSLSRRARAPVTITFSANSRTFAANAHCGGVNKCTFADGHQTPFRQTLWGGHGLRMPNTIEPNDADALAGYTRNRNQRGIENSKQQWKWSRVKQNAEHVMLCAIWMTQEYIHKSQRACKTHFRIILIHIVEHTASNADVSSKSRERFACVAVVRCINLSVFSRPGAGRLKSWTRQHNVSLVHFHKFPFIRFCCQLSLICPLFSVSVYLTEKKINVFMFVSST